MFLEVLKFLDTFDFILNLPVSVPFKYILLNARDLPCVAVIARLHSLLLRLELILNPLEVFQVRR